MPRRLRVLAAMKTLVLPRFRRARHSGGSLGLAAIDGQSPGGGSRHQLLASWRAAASGPSPCCRRGTRPGLSRSTPAVRGSPGTNRPIALVDGSTTDVAAQLDLHRPGRISSSPSPARTRSLPIAPTVPCCGWTGRRSASPRRSSPSVTMPRASSLSVGGGTAYAVDNRRGIVVGLDPTTLAVRRTLCRSRRESPLTRAWSTATDACGASTTPPVTWSPCAPDRTVASRAGTAGKVALLAANRRPVAVDLAQHTVSRLDAKSGQLAGTQPIELRKDDAVSVGASPGADEVFAAGGDEPRASIICDLEAGANRVVQLPPGLSRLGRPVEAHGRVFVPDLGTGLVHIVDTTSRRSVTSVTVPGGRPVNCS